MKTIINLYCVFVLLFASLKVIANNDTADRHLDNPETMAVHLEYPSTGVGFITDANNVAFYPDATNDPITVQSAVEATKGIAEDAKSIAANSLTTEGDDGQLTKNGSRVGRISINSDGGNGTLEIGAPGTGTLLLGAGSIKLSGAGLVPSLISMPYGGMISVGNNASITNDTIKVGAFNIFSDNPALPNGHIKHGEYYIFKSDASHNIYSDYFLRYSNDDGRIYVPDVNRQGTSSVTNLTLGANFSYVDKYDNDNGRLEVGGTAIGGHIIAKGADGGGKITVTSGSFAKGGFYVDDENVLDIAADSDFSLLTETNITDIASRSGGSLSNDSIAGMLSNTQISMRVTGKTLTLTDNGAVVWQSSSSGGSSEEAISRIEDGYTNMVVVATNEVMNIMPLNRSSVMFVPTTPTTEGALATSLIIDSFPIRADGATEDFIVYVLNNSGYACRVIIPDGESNVKVYSPGLVPIDLYADDGKLTAFRFSFVGKDPLTNMYIWALGRGELTSL